MGEIYLIVLFFNIFFISLVLWALTFIGYIVTNNKIMYDTHQLYECGFISLTKTNILVNLSTISAGIFLLLYEIEFFLLIPAFFNIFTLSNTVKLLVMWFIFIVIFTLLMDNWFFAINWNY